MAEDALTLDLSIAEAELLIAVLQFAEGAAAELSPALVAAIEDMKPLRSRLISTYLHAMTEGPDGSMVFSKP